MEITGTITGILEEQKGEGRNGPWRKQEFILETEGMYPRKVCIAVWGDKIDQFAIKEGEKVTMAVNIESREFNGRWYTDVKAWKLDRSASQFTVSGDPPPFDEAPLPDEEPPLPSEEDDLPF
ncbi:MAG: DUF3127 domain-containing protein [Bacteroidales bacterium]|nr:DUF3127 domain-containing protein [Bacteroidales bacterium]